MDDGSSDESWKIITEYVDGNCGKVKEIKKKNGEPNSTRQRGIEIADGEFVMFIDADDYVDETICQKLIQALNTQKIDMTLSRTAKVLNSINEEMIDNWKSQKYMGGYIAENILDPNTHANSMAMGLYRTLYKIDILKRFLEK